MAITTVVLHGPLGREFGKKWKLDISNPAEAIRAIDCARPGFRQRFLDLDARGLVFRVLVGKPSRQEAIEEDALDFPVQANGKIDIVPIARGAGAGVRFILGAVLFAVGFVFSYTPFGMPLMAMGMSLMIGAVTEWLTPSIKKKTNDESSLKSYAFSGPVNNVEQGYPVPVIYGEVLTGSHVISASIIAEELIGGGDPSTVIDGVVERACTFTPGFTSDYNGKTYTPASCTNTFKMLGRVTGMVAPLTFTWTFSPVSGSWQVTEGGSHDDFLTVVSTASSTLTALANITLSVTDKYDVTKSKTVQIKSEHNEYIEYYYNNAG